MGPEVIIALTALLGLYMAWTIGANDVANSMGCAVGSRAISVKKAVIAAGVCEFAGAVLVGSHVTDTVRKGIVQPSSIAAIPGITEHEAAALLILGMACALLATAIWLNIATWRGMPVSTTHSIVGAVAGFGIVAVGWSAVEWHKLGQIAASWFLSPLVGGLLGFLLFRVISKLVLGRKRPVPRAIIVAPFIVFLVTVVITLSITYKGLKHVSSVADWLTGPRAILLAMLLGLVAGGISRLLVQRALKGKEGLPLSDQLALVEGVFAPLVVISSCSVAFSHGANDVANAVGPLAAIVDIVASGTVKMKVAVPMWVLILGGVGIVIGLATYGYRVMHTIGTKITEMTPSRGVAANVAAATTVLVCTRMGLPVSTTHTLVGAVLGIGLARGLTGINRQVTRDIFTAWIITVPAAALLTVVFFLIGKALFFESILRAMQ